MKILHRGLVVFVGLIVFAAAGGVWSLYREESPVAGTVDALTWGGPPVEPERREIVEPAPEPAMTEDPETPLEWPEGVVAGDLLLRFESEADLRAFLRNARQAGLAVDLISELRVVRVRTRDDGEARRAMRLAKGAEPSFNANVAMPEVPPLDGISVAYTPFGEGALEWMGVPEDREHWGEGVRIAVLDTGVTDHPLLYGASIRHMSVLGEGVDKGTHGTAVASLLVGELGMVPAAELLSIQVMGGDGTGNAFDLAAGIIAAMNAGVDIINISAGTDRHNSVLLAAVQEAKARGIKLVGSAGNDGGGRLMYPAAYADVFAVGAVDADGQHLPFSNRGNGLAFTAPGLGVLTAGGDGDIILSHGTSFSGPYVAGAMAALDSKRPGEETVRILMETANDGGAAGADPLWGYGMLDMRRALEYGRPGIYDVAAAGHYLDLTGNVPQLIVNVQNRGTEIVGNVHLKVDVNGRTRRFSIGTLGVNQVGSGAIPVPDLFRKDEPIRVWATVSAAGVKDRYPDNDSKGTVITINKDR